MDFSEKLKDTRKRYGLTLAELEELSGLSKSFLSYLERGEKSPTIDTIEKLADAFGISIIELIGQDKYILQNLLLIMGNLSVNEFLEDIRKKTGHDIFDAEDIKNYISGKVIPSAASLQIFADYAGISLEFFYKRNDTNSLEKERNELLNVRHQYPDVELERILTNQDYVRILKKVYSNDIDISTIENIIDAIINQKKK